MKEPPFQFRIERDVGGDESFQGNPFSLGGTQRMLESGEKTFGEKNTPLYSWVEKED